MRIEIESAQTRKDADDGTVANVRFRVAGHPKPYEITLFSKSGRDWEYGLHFAEESGSEELIDEVEAYLEEDDAAFRRLVDAALAAEGSAGKA